MKRKDQMKVILEILDLIDLGDTAEPQYCFDYYGQVRERAGSIAEQYPKDDVYCKIINWLFTDAHIKEEKAMELLSSKTI